MQAEHLVGRGSELELALEILRQEGAGAVLVVADPGIGKTALSDEIAARLASEMVVMRVHGSPALSAVPYGVLAPYLLDLPVEQATSPVAILREFWSQFEKRRGGEGARLLLIVDDAHELDPSIDAVRWRSGRAIRPARQPGRYPGLTTIRSSRRKPGPSALGDGWVPADAEAVQRTVPQRKNWVPAFAGMSGMEVGLSPRVRARAGSS